MRKMLLMLLALIAVSVFASFAAFAAVDPASVVSPDFVAGVLASISAIPTIGPIIGVIVKWLGLIAGVLTVLSATVQAILILPQLVAVVAGAPALADKIKSVSDTVLPWLKYLSMFNVQNKKA